MEKYNYFESVKEDVKDYIISEGVEVTEENREEVAESLNENLFSDDSVTGNASGSYTFNRATAEDYINGNLDLLADALEEFGGVLDVLRQGAEACDVTIRCYLLRQAIDEVLDEILEEQS